MKITKKYYNKRKHKFYIERTCNDGHVLTNEYETFNSFFNEPSEQNGKTIIEQLVQLPEYNIGSIE